MVVSSRSRTGTPQGGLGYTSAIRLVKAAQTSNPGALSKLRHLVHSAPFPHITAFPALLGQIL